VAGDDDEGEAQVGPEGSRRYGPAIGVEVLGARPAVDHLGDPMVLLFFRVGADDVQLEGVSIALAVTPEGCSELSWWLGCACGGAAGSDPG